MAITVDGQVQPQTNWFEIVSSEVRAWWETFQQAEARTQPLDPMIEQWRWQMLQGTPQQQQQPPAAQAGISTNTAFLLLGAIVVVMLMNK